MSITILNIKESIKTLMENYKIPYEAIEDLEEELEELNMENEWGKTATLKYNEVLQENKKLEHSYMKANLQLCDEMDTLKKENKKLKEENENLKEENEEANETLNQLGFYKDEGDDKYIHKDGPWGDSNLFKEIQES
jgi:chromosome segregation ATPase